MYKCENTIFNKLNTNEISFYSYNKDGTPNNNQSKTLKTDKNGFLIGDPGLTQNRNDLPPYAFRSDKKEPYFYILEIDEKTKKLKHPDNLTPYSACLLYDSAANCDILASRGEIKATKSATIKSNKNKLKFSSEVASASVEDSDDNENYEKIINLLENIVSNQK